MQGRALRVLLGGAALVVIIAGLRAAAPLLVPLLISVFLALIVFPLVLALQRRKLPGWAAVTTALILVLVALAGPGLIVQRTAGEFASALPRYRERLQQVSTYVQQWLSGYGVDVGELSATLDPGILMDLVGFTITGLAGLVSNLFLVLLTMTFILLEATAFTRKLREARSLRTEDPDYLSRMPADVQRYLWIKTALSLATGLLAGLWVAVLGVDFAILWGFLAFILNYIPNFGSILAAIPPVLLTALQFGPGWALLVALGYVAINMVLGNLLEPMLMGRRLGLSPLVVLLSLIFWGWLWGAVGMLLSVPLTMVVKLVMENDPQLRWLAVLLGNEPAPPPPATA